MAQPTTAPFRPCWSCSPTNHPSGSPAHPEDDRAAPLRPRQRPYGTRAASPSRRSPSCTRTGPFAPIFITAEHPTQPGLARHHPPSVKGEQVLHDPNHTPATTRRAPTRLTRDITRASHARRARRRRGHTGHRSAARGLAVRADDQPVAAPRPLHARIKPSPQRRCSPSSRAGRSRHTATPATSSSTRCAGSARRS